MALRRARTGRARRRRRSQAGSRPHVRRRRPAVARQAWLRGRSRRTDSPLTPRRPTAGSIGERSSRPVRCDVEAVAASAELPPYLGSRTRRSNQRAGGRNRSRVSRSAGRSAARFSRACSRRPWTSRPSDCRGSIESHGLRGSRRELLDKSAIRTLKRRGRTSWVAEREPCRCEAPGEESAANEQARRRSGRRRALHSCAVPTIRRMAGARACHIQGTRSGARCRRSRAGLRSRASRELRGV